MKHIFFLVLFTSIINVNAQIPDGSYAQNFSISAIQPWLSNSGLNANGTYNLYQYLDQGYDVIICFDAGWSGPSWNYHLTGALKTLYQQHGPIGHPGVNANTTNELMVFWIDVDAGGNFGLITSDSCLFGLSGGCIGNWTNPNNSGQINFPMANVNQAISQSLIAKYDIIYFPLIYKICTNRQTTTFESGSPSSYSNLISSIQQCPSISSNGNDVSYFGYSGKRNVCYSSYTPKVIVQNNGNTALNNVSISITSNGNLLSSGNYPVSLNTYDTTLISCNPILNFNGGDLQINVLTNNDVNSSNNTSSVFINGANTLSSQSITTNITTDQKGSDITWVILDLNDNIIYQEGPYIDNINSGSYPQTPTTIQLDPNQCYTFRINDSYGDGLCCLYGSGGFNVKDATNNTIVSNASFLSSYERMFKTNNCGAQTQTVNVSSCDNYLSQTGILYNQTGNYLETSPNFLDCPLDSFYLNIQITNSVVFSFYDTICGGPFIWNGISYSNSGNYTQNFPSQNGCDSVVTLHLMVYSNNFNPTFSSSQQLFTSPPFAVQFSNTTTNPSNYNFTWYWGDGTSTTSNNATVFHEYLTNGLYTVTLEARSMQTGCFDETTLTDYIYTTGGVSCTHSAIINQTGPISACSGQGVVLSCNYSPTYSYQWRRNGVYISGNNNDSLLVTQPGAYSVIISDNGCPVSSSQVTVNFSTIAAPVISSNGSIQPCVGGSVTLSTTAGFTSYLWSNGATTPSTNVTSSGSYTVQVTNSSGCSATSNPFTINASILPTQNICVVGVDSLTNNIRVVWEKPITSAIDSFYVYRETSVSNVYSQVGARPYDSLSVWLDPIANPAVQAYRYKLTALDTCGSETPLSNFHKTIHLTINQGVGNAWNLIWSNYEGISFGSYNIYRGTTLNNLSLLTSIQSNLNSYTDLSAPSGNVYYQIEIVNPNNCVPTKSINYSISKSNIVNTNSNSIDEINESSISVYPNPANELLIIESGILLNSKFRIIDAIGRTVYQGFLSSSKNSLDISSFSRGTYTLIVENLGKPVRFVKQ
jgi:hypothetical protein